jgi:cation:H+ antiporter
VGNVVGSNIFNGLGVAGLASAIHPIAAGALGRLDLWVMLAVAAVALPIVWTGHRVSRGEGALLTLGY